MKNLIETFNNIRFALPYSEIIERSTGVLCRGCGGRRPFSVGRSPGAILPAGNDNGQQEADAARLENHARILQQLIGDTNDPQSRERPRRVERISLGRRAFLALVTLY